MTTPTFVLIPGAGGAAWYWNLVEAELRNRGYDAISVGLPGADENAGLPQYLDIVVQAVSTVDDHTELIMVGQSLGAFTASLACDQLPVSTLVLLNAMIPAPGETPGDWWTNTGQAEARRALDEQQGRDPDAEFDPMIYFLHDVSPTLIAEGEGHQNPEADAVFATPWNLTAWPDVPTRVLSSRDDRFFPLAFQRRIAQQRLGITPDEIDGGHLVALSDPIGVTDRLESYRVASGNLDPQAGR
ncbi:alpha/beta fold hydrolase [Jatrophihabitans sp. DSM 45814]